MLQHVSVAAVALSTTQAATLTIAYIKEIIQSPEDNFSD